MRKKIFAVDLFCGAGGTSQGLLMAANELRADLELIAINHWNVAIDTHSVNHPYAKHLCTGLDEIGDPRKLVPGGRLNLLCGSPECTHHSVARGGKPMSDQSRSSAWHILRFAEALYIDNLLIENVPEFLSWGPLGVNGRPLKSKRGQLFEQFIASLRALGYSVEWRVLNCADYGDPTTRRRLFIIARRGNKAIRWPDPTHVPATQLSQDGLFADERKPWRSAREIIDWSIPSKSIFDRKKPLADKTLARIQAGLKKFCGLDVDLKRCFTEDLRPFLVVFRNHQDAQSIDEPVPTLTTIGANVGLVEPFIIGAGGPTRHGKPRGLNEPMRVVLTRNHSHLVQPFVMQTDQTGSNGSCVRSADSPLITLVTKENTAVVEPFIVPQGRWNEARPVDRPIDSITTTSRGVGLIEPFLTHFRGDHAGRSDGEKRSSSLNSPLPTQDTSNRFGLAEPFVVTVNHGEGSSPRSARSVDEPMPTATQKIGEGLCQPFIIAYYGTDQFASPDEPLQTITTKDRFGLIEAEITHYRLDIRFRMLQPRELARAQGFPDEYIFTGNREAVVKQIGNAVPPNTAKALISEVLA